MSQLILENLKTLRNRLVKDHKAQLELLDKQIEAVVELNQIAGIAAPERKTTTTLPKINTPTSKINPNKYDYIIRNVDTSVFSDDRYRAIALTEVDKTTGAMLDDIYYFDRSGMQLREFCTKLKLRTASFGSTLINQAMQGERQIEVRRFAEAGITAINVVAMRNERMGKPVTYFFDTGTLTLNYQQQAYLAQVTVSI